MVDGPEATVIVGVVVDAELVHNRSLAHVMLSRHIF